MTPLRIAIVDDEDLARRLVREYLEDVPDVEVVAECANGFDAVRAVSEHKPDLLLLDVQMPKLTGFEVVELVGRDQPVVFVTAYDQYALRAFEVHAVDYLLKPFERDRLMEALDRARQRIERREPEPARAAVAAAGDARIDRVEWSRLHDDARAIAAALQARGAGAGSHVAVIGPTAWVTRIFEFSSSITSTDSTPGTQRATWSTCSKNSHRRSRRSAMTKDSWTFKRAPCRPVRD